METPGRGSIGKKGTRQERTSNVHRIGKRTDQLKKIDLQEESPPGTQLTSVWKGLSKFKVSPKYLSLRTMKYLSSKMYCAKAGKLRNSASLIRSVLRGVNRNLNLPAVIVLMGLPSHNQLCHVCEV